MIRVAVSHVVPRQGYLSGSEQSFSPLFLVMFRIRTQSWAQLWLMLAPRLSSCHSLDRRSISLEWSKRRSIWYVAGIHHDGLEPFVTHLLLFLELKSSVRYVMNMFANDMDMENIHYGPFPSFEPCAAM